MSAVAFSKEVEKLNHCSGCGREHLSQHFHVINPSDRAIVARRFPRLGQLWRAVADKTVLRLCCLWFVDGHNTRIHHLAASLARQEPLADAAPRSIRRISSISLDAHDSHDVDVSAPPPKKAKVNESLQLSMRSRPRSGARRTRRSSRSSPASSRRSRRRRSASRMLCSVRLTTRNALVMFDDHTVSGWKSSCCVFDRYRFRCRF
jgi:hypothetical protein